MTNETRAAKRQQIFITTKIWPHEFGFENTYAAVVHSLVELQVDYLDLVLLHKAGMEKGRSNELKEIPSCALPTTEGANSHNWRLCRAGSWAALEHLKATGVIRSIGVSNFDTEKLKELETYARFPPAVNQFELHPWNWPMQKYLVEYCNEKKIAVTAFASLGSPAESNVQLAAQHETVKAIGEQYGRSSHQTLLRWAIQKGVAVIPGTSNLHHMEANLDPLFDFELQPREMQFLDNISDGHVVYLHSHDPKNII